MNKKMLCLVITLVFGTIGLCACGNVGDNTKETQEKSESDKVSDMIEVFKDTVDDAISEVTEDDYVRSVKGAVPKSYPDKNYGDAFEQFFGNPSWKHFTGTREGSDEDGDGKPDYVEENVEVVEFTGKCMYEDVKVTALIQFEVDMETMTFEPTFLSYNEIPQNMLMLNMLLSNVFESGENQEEERKEKQEEEQKQKEEQKEKQKEEQEKEYEEITDSNKESTENNVAIEYYELSGKYESETGNSCSVSMYSSYDDEAVGNVEISTSEMVFKGVLIPYDVNMFEAVADDGSTLYVQFCQNDGKYTIELMTYEKEHIDDFVMTEHYMS